MMPALTIDTHPRQRSESPSRPPISPITPPPRDDDSNNSTNQDNNDSNPFARHTTYTHSQPNQTSVPPPNPIPISFDSNPDVIALRAAISVLQVQKMRAASDMQALSRAKDEALQDPLEFTRDLVAGKVRSGDAPEPPDASEIPDASETPDISKTPDASETDLAASRPWRSLPGPQDIVRCPPINWSQYAVVGESLDKLHAEQLARPTQGTPATVGPGGMYEFKAGDGVQEAYRGVADPYSPLRDKIDRKPKKW